VPGTRGRRRDAETNDQKVLDAARAVFARDGWDAPVSAVAAEAGVGMGSLYRRYGSKAELLQHLCVLSMRQSITAAEHALDAADPQEGLHCYILECVEFGAGAFAPLAGTIPVTDQMVATAKHSHKLLTRLVRRAQAADLVRDDIDAADVTAIIQRFSRDRPDPGTDGARLDDRIIALTLDGLTAATANRSPLPTPAARHYHASLWNPTEPHGGEPGTPAAPSGLRPSQLARDNDTDAGQ
jgi:AcrR family transcriptional regulator